MEAQLAIVVVVITLAVVYLAASVLFRWRRRGACGGGCGCAKPPASSGVQTLGLQRLRR